MKMRYLNKLVKVTIYFSPILVLVGCGPDCPEGWVKVPETVVSSGVTTDCPTGPDGRSECAINAEIKQEIKYTCSQPPTPEETEDMLRAITFGWQTSNGIIGSRNPIVEISLRGQSGNLLDRRSYSLDHYGSELRIKNSVLDNAAGWMNTTALSTAASSIEYNVKNAFVSPANLNSDTIVSGTSYMLGIAQSADYALIPRESYTGGLRRINENISGF